MALKNWAYIYLSPGFSLKTHTVEVRSEACVFKAVGLDFKEKERVTEVAKELVENGAQMIELCGGFGPFWVAKVMEATEFKVPIGSTAYGPESRGPLLEITEGEL